MKKVLSIFLKCNIGSRTTNGKVMIDGIRKFGYSNIVFVNSNKDQFDYE